MAAVTIVSQSRMHVIGDRRMKGYKVTVANSGDTLTVAGMKSFTSVSAEPATALAAGITFTGNVITFLSAASNPTAVLAIGV